MIFVTQTAYMTAARLQKISKRLNGSGLCWIPAVRNIPAGTVLSIPYALGEAQPTGNSHRVQTLQGGTRRRTGSAKFALSCERPGPGGTRRGPAESPRPMFQ